MRQPALQYTNGVQPQLVMIYNEKTWLKPLENFSALFRYSWTKEVYSLQMHAGREWGESCQQKQNGGRYKATNDIVGHGWSCCWFQPRPWPDKYSMGNSDSQPKESMKCKARVEKMKWACDRDKNLGGNPAYPASNSIGLIVGAIMFIFLEYIGVDWS